MPYLLGQYINGNYKTLLMSDGSKIRMNKFNNFTPAFPESMDVKITNSCKGPDGLGPCPYCHEQSVPNGKHGNLSHPIFDSIHPYTELALGGGNVLEHPDLLQFLYRMKKKHIICNMTLHTDHFMKNYDYVRMLEYERLIHGIGVSVNTVPSEEQLDKIQHTPNLVVHTIAGVMPEKGYKLLYGRGIKLLILGYKYYGRGEKYFLNEENQIMDNVIWLRSALPEMISHFKLISFDNLALKQLRIQEIVDKDTWEKCYMGDDGQFTCYLDMVEEMFAKSSTSERLPINSDRIEDLFNQVRAAA